MDITSTAATSTIITQQTARPPHRNPPGFTQAAGAFYLCMAGIHGGIVAADAQTYRSFAEGSPWGFVRGGWSDVFMSAPETWGLILAVGEATLGVLLLAGGVAARVGWVGIITFQTLLVLFGWGFLAWSVPATAVLLLGAHHDWPLLGPHARLNPPG